MNVLYISSTCIDENTGEGRLVIEGQLTVPNKCDDPIVELFRPIRKNQEDEMLYIVTLSRHESTITCSLVPSNHKEKEFEVFLKDALKVLKGDSKSAGILDNYKAMLELFFTEKTGLEQWKKALDKGDFAKCNEIIKTFVADLGFTMPSMHQPEKQKKTKEQKKEDSLKYQEEHPEIKKKSKKKPAK
ncbi:hypothetical protein IKG38_03920 [Candidatus Saccharibacteria bacterium]|nr:hypothetical protein [Candidatus Saccharibacteria bacterium]